LVVGAMAVIKRAKLLGYTREQAFLSFAFPEDDGS